MIDEDRRLLMNVLSLMNQPLFHQQSKQIITYQRIINIQPSLDVHCPNKNLDTWRVSRVTHDEPRLNGATANYAEWLLFGQATAESWRIWEDGSYKGGTLWAIIGFI